MSTIICKMNNIHNREVNYSDEIVDTKKRRAFEKKVRFQLPEIPVNFVNVYVYFS